MFRIVSKGQAQPTLGAAGTGVLGKRNRVGAVGQRPLGVRGWPQDAGAAATFLLRQQKRSLSGWDLGGYGN